mgnify:CR=1 FL=1
MVFDVKMLREEREEKLRKKPSNYKQRAARWARIHPKISLVTGTLLVAGLAYSILPLGFLFFLPDFVVRQVVYALIGGIAGFYSGRALYRRFGRPQTEIVREINIAESPMVKRYRTLRGSFKQNYEFKNGRPVEETRNDGTPIYNVIKIDKSEGVAYCSHLGDTPQAKLFETKEAINAQFMYNDKLRKLGAEIDLKLEQIVSQVEHQYANAFIRKLDTVARPEDLVDASRDGVPSVSPDIETPDLDDIMDRAGIENPRDLEPKNKPQSDLNEQ